MKSGVKETLKRDFEEKLNQLQSRIRAYCYAFGSQFWYDLNNTMKTIQDFFQSWMKKIGQ